MTISKPQQSNPPIYFDRYINLVPHDDLMVSLKETQVSIINIAKLFIGGKEDYRYEAGKWTIKQVFQHIVDTERVMLYRAFGMSRKDTTNFPSFDHEAYAENDQTDSKSLTEIIAEYESLRADTIQFYKTIQSNVLDFEGTANGLPLTPRKLGFIMTGHAMHHINILNAYYLK